MVSVQKPSNGLVHVSVGSDFIIGDLLVPNSAIGLVIFAHGSSRFSCRNKFVASELNKANIATLLIDLLTEKEDLVNQNSREYCFDIPLLAAAKDNSICSVVSRGGRPDLAQAYLAQVKAPTLLIVGANDKEAIKLN